MDELGSPSEEEAGDQVAEVRNAPVTVSDHGQRLDRFLVQQAPEFSRNHLQSLVERGLVSIDGVTVTKDARKLKAGEQVRVELQPTEESRAFRPEAMPLSIVHEDEHLLVVNKRVGLVVHPAPGNWSGTLMNGLLAYHPAAATLPRGGIVHRLDKDTSGLMVVGKTLEGVTALSRMIAAREVHREYIALVHGRFPESKVIDAPLRRDPITKIRMAQLPGGKPSRTDVYALDQAEVEGRAITAVHCVLHSGRTHQIRVHLATHGHPLLADELYGGAPALGLTRQALHAARLSFAHPISGQALVFDAPMPQDLQQAWALAGLQPPVLDRPAD